MTTLTVKLTDDDIEAIANKLFAKLNGVNGSSTTSDLLNVYQAAEFLGLKCKDKRNVSNRMSQLSNPRLTEVPLVVHYAGGSGRTRFYKREDLLAFMTRGKRN